MICAALQLRTGVDPAANLRHVSDLARAAHAVGAELICTPEGTNFLQNDPIQRALLLKPADQDGVVQGLRALAKELSVVLVVGSVLVLDGTGRPVNRSLLIDRTGSVRAHYDKIHMFDVDLGDGQTYRESETYAAGDRAVVTVLPEIKLGLSICYDLRFPHLYQALARAGAEVMLIPAAFTVPTGQAHWAALLRARAIETGSYVIAAAQGGVHADGRSTWGHSMIIDPWGEELAVLAHDEPGFMCADLDPERVAEVRRKIPALANNRPFSGPEIVTI